MNDKNNLDLSWRWPFAQTGPFTQGRNVESVAKFMQAAGQPQDKYCSDDITLAPDVFMNAQISLEGAVDSMKRRIGNHWWIKFNDLNELCAAIVKEPILITFGGVNKDWQKPFDQIVTQTPGAGSDWYHAVVAWDYDLDEGWIRIKNWWGDKERKISINYQLTSALSFADLPDEGETMFKVIKTADKADNWVITGNTRRRIPDADTYHYFKGQLGIITDPITVPQAEVDKYVIGEMIPSVKLMRALEGVAKDIFYEE